MASGSDNVGWTDAETLHVCQDAFTFYNARANTGYYIFGAETSHICQGVPISYSTNVNIEYYFVFLTLFIAISIISYLVRETGGNGTKLIGPGYLTSLLFAIISLILDCINITRRKSSTNDQLERMTRVSKISYHMSGWGLLFIVFYRINILLRKQLGSAIMLFRTIPLVILGITGALYVAYIVMEGYIQSTQAYGYWDRAYTMMSSTQKLAFVARVFYVFSVVASAALAAMTISGLRKAHLPAGRLIGWVLALHTCMFLWSTPIVILQGLSNHLVYFDSSISFALSYTMTFLQALSFLALLEIAGHACWEESSMPTQQAYAPVMQ